MASFLFGSSSLLVTPSFEVRDLTDFVPLPQSSPLVVVPPANANVRSTAAVPPPRV